jgi:hypothetical protein
MDEILGALAFALLIGGQFLAVIVLTWTGKALYADPNERVHRSVEPTGECPKAATLQHCATPDLALARLELTQHASGRAVRIPGEVAVSAGLDSGSSARPERPRPHFRG